MRRGMFTVLVVLAVWLVLTWGEAATPAEPILSGPLVKLDIKDAEVATVRGQTQGHLDSLPNTMPSTLAGWTLSSIFQPLPSNTTTIWCTTRSSNPCHKASSPTVWPSMPRSRPTSPKPPSACARAQIPRRPAPHHGRR